MAFRVATQKRGGGTVYSLHDESSGASAAVLPDAGFNLFDLQLPVAGKLRPVLMSPANWADHPTPGAGNGTPILFPYPNRVAGGRFEFAGASYELPVNNGPNAIHGWALAAKWDVIEHAVRPEGATIVGQYRISQQSPDHLNQWPADAVLEVRYTLAGRRLIMDVEVTNPTAHPLPYGLGIHPYFRMPFDDGADQSKTRVILPASQYWPLRDFLPTGERKPVDAEPRLDFRAGQPMKGLQLDDVLTGLDGEPRLCRLVDDNLHAEFQLGFDANFRELVVYTPPGPGGVISLEPYTQTTNAVNLAAQGIDGGLRVLGHGQADTLRITMETVG